MNTLQTPRWVQRVREINQTIQARRAEISKLAAEKRALVQVAATQLSNTEIARHLGITLAQVDQIINPRYPKKTA